jgi:hypothetical protein
MKDSLYTTTYRLAVTGKTSLLLQIKYQYYAGFAGSQFDPPEPASIEIQLVTHCSYEVDFLLYSKYEDELLKACWKHTKEEQDAAIYAKADAEWERIQESCNGY